MYEHICLLVHVVVCVQEYLDVLLVHMCLCVLLSFCHVIWQGVNGSA